MIPIHTLAWVALIILGGWAAWEIADSLASIIRYWRTRHDR
jgi:hypothetical protein